MKKLLPVAVAALLSNSFLAQEIPFHRCASHTAIEYQESLTPGYKALVDAAFDAAKAQGASNEAKNNILYTIPVVVHVVYNTAEENLPDSVIIDQIRVLNEDYQRLNADTVNMRSEFDIVKGYPGIQFKLAQIDPNGNPTTGITRTSTTLDSFGSLAFLSGDMSDLERVKSTSDGGIDPWDQSRYLNIWVCDMSILGFTALLGYATPPAGLPNWPPGPTGGLGDGVVIQYQVLGSNNPNEVGGGYVAKGRTTTHEVGHYLGLRHIWGDGDCTAQDGIDDTPNADAQSNTDCDPSKNTCTDNIQSADLSDMIENYMDYSAEDCQNSFTEGQVELMHGVLELQRYDLVHNNPANLDDLAEALSVYPNPANNVLQLSGAVLTAYSVFDLSGQLVKSEASISGKEININGLNSGMYLLQGTTSQGQVLSTRFVKN